MEELNEILEKCYDTCDLLQANTNWNHEIDIRDILKVNLLSFTMYIASSDGNINGREATVISSIAGGNMTPAAIREYIRDHNIYSTEFEQTVPESLKIFVQIDNALTEAGRAEDDHVCNLLLELYKVFASAIVQAENNGGEREQADWEIYVKMLNDYLDENLISRKSALAESKAAGRKDGKRLADIYHFIDGLKEEQKK